MKLGVFGPHYYRRVPYDNYEYIENVLLAICQRFSVDCIHTGGGAGIEQLALRFATLNNKLSEVTPPNIKRDGVERAFVVRNHEIVAKVDHIVLFWDSKYVELLEHATRNRTPITVYGLE